MPLDLITLDDGPTTTLVDGAAVIEDGDTTTVDLSPDAEPSGFVYSEASHSENLVDYLDAMTLSRLAAQVIEDVDADKEARADWHEWVAKSMTVFGIQPPANEKTKFSQVIHPMLAEGIVQTQARLLSEILPPEGPAKGIQLGEKTEEKQAQAERAKDYINYHLTEKDEGYFEDSDQMFLFLAKDGSVFRKVYYDPIEDMNVARMVKAEDLIVPYTTTSLRTSLRHTHQFRLSEHEHQRYVDVGHFADVKLHPAEPLNEEEDEAQEAYDTADNRTNSQSPNDGQYQFYEQYLYFNFKELTYPGKPVLNELTGEEMPGAPEQASVPYVVTVEKDSQKVVAVYLDWRFGDERRKRRATFIHHKYLPGFGFYGMGLTHLLGHLSSAATGIVRAILDSASRAIFPAGFRSKDVKIPAGEHAIEPGEFRESECSADELAKAFFPLPFKEPGDSMFKMLEIILGAGQRIGSTVDAMVGDASNTGPVGTTVALIEQGSKILSGVHKRVHASMRRELRAIAAAQYEYGQDIEHWNYEGGSGQVMREDFDDRIDITLVSDPNLFSATQKTAIGQAMLELYKQFPGLFDEFDVVEYIVKAINGPVHFLKDPKDTPRCDPVTEGSRAIAGKPIRAFQDQDHDAHLIVHDAQVMMAQQMMAPEQAQLIVAKLLEHKAQHQAFQYQNAVQQDSLEPLPPLDLYEGESLPAEAEIVISQQEAQVVAQMQQRMMMQQQAEAMAQQQQQQAQQDQQAQQEQAVQQQEADKERADQEGQREHEIKLAKIKKSDGEAPDDTKDQAILSALQQLAEGQQALAQQIQALTNPN